MRALSPKERRKIDRAVDLLFSKKGFVVPQRPEDFKVEDFFSKMLRLENDRTILLTDGGMNAVKEIVAILDQADSFEGLAAYSDLWSACTKVIVDLCSKSHRPDDGAEYVALATEAVRNHIGAHRFVVALFGIELKGVDELGLGSLRVVRPSRDYIDSLGVVHTGSHVERFVGLTKSYLWLTGSVRGTDTVAKHKFREMAHLATGILAIVAASLYEHGAHGVRIGIAMSPEEMQGRAQYLSWLETNKALTVTQQFARGQALTIDERMRTDIEASDVGKRAFVMVESEHRTELEEAIVRAIYWYSDAHRDERAVMRLLKYWSCIEALFSGKKEDITRSVSIGLAATLTHGHVDCALPEHYASLKKRIAALYGQRSKAAHGAAYRHVTDKEVSDLSQWISWLVVNAIVFVQQGMTTTEQMTEWAYGIDARVARTQTLRHRMRQHLRAVIDTIRIAVGRVFNRQSG